MEKNLYFRTVIRRQNILKTTILDFSFKLTSWPRMVLEVFLRKNFGERYFSLASAITVAVILILLPVAASSLPTNRYGEQPSFWGQYATWYLFVAAFLFFTNRRWQEIKTSPSVFDFARFSLYSGDIQNAFFKARPNGKRLTIRQIEILYEPLLFFVAGLLLMLIGQKLGLLWIVCSIFYSLGYAGAYKRGDDFVMDIIDEIILNEEKQVFINDAHGNNDRGVRFYARRPHAKEDREKVAESFSERSAFEETTYAT